MKWILLSISSKTIQDDVNDINNASSSKSTKGDNKINVNSKLPDCWTTKLADEFREKYDGLLVISRQLSCGICAKVESVNVKATHISREWRSCSVVRSGK